MAHQIAPEIYYPESDGQPMGETNLHRWLTVQLEFALARYFKGRSDVYVSGNIFIYFVAGDPNQSVCPDLLVAFGVAPARRDVYKTWEDGPFPQVVFEIVSARTRRQDLSNKPGLYEQLGALEYYSFDPDPPQRRRMGAPEAGDLRCYRRKSASERFAPMERVGPDVVAHSDLLGLGLVVRGRELRLLDEATGTELPTAEEEAQAHAAEAEARARAEEQLRAQAEELARLRAELEKRSTD